MTAGLAFWGNSAPPPSATDPFWSNVQLLLLADSGTTIADSSSNAATVTAAGNAALSSAQFFTGSKSIAFDGAGDWLTIPDQAGYNLGANEFSIEALVRVGAAVADFDIMASYSATGTDFGYLLKVDSARKLVFAWSATGVDGSATAVTSVSALTAGAWHWVQCVRDASNTIKFAVDGVAFPTVTTPAVGTIFNSATALSIGGIPSIPRSASGYMQMVRITNGNARAFSLPAFPLPMA